MNTIEEIQQAYRLAAEQNCRLTKLMISSEQADALAEECARVYRGAGAKTEKEFRRDIDEGEARIFGAKIVVERKE